MGHSSRHAERDRGLPEERRKLLETLSADLSDDHSILAVYLGGSLAEGTSDLYSDIDLRVVVEPGAYDVFVADKLRRPRRWGDVLFFEDGGPGVSHTVAHFACFVKVDVFYYQPGDLRPSLFMKSIRIVHDPLQMVDKVQNESRQLAYAVSRGEFERWQGKVLAHLHETYRGVMRDELSYALQMMTGLAGWIMRGWHMEAGRPPDLWADWPKAEGARSALAHWQVSLLGAWHCRRDPDEIMKTVASMVPELLRLNHALSRLAGAAEDRELWAQAIGMVL